MSKKNRIGARKAPKLTADHGDPSVVPIRGPDALESTMPPTPLRELLAADGASIYVLTNDSALLEVVQQGGGEQYPVFHADAWPVLRAAVVEKRCGVALLDFDAVGGALADRLFELSRLNPALVTLVASAREHADELLDLLSKRKIHRLLIKPPTLGITRLLLESSVNRHFELRRRPEIARPVAAERKGVPTWVVAGALALTLLVALGVAGLLTLWNQGAEAPPTSPSVSAPPLARPAEPAPDAATDAPRGPDGAPVAAAEPLPPEPAGPTAEALEARYAEVEAALVADELDTAAVLLAELEAIDAGSSRLAFLGGQLERARTAAELAAAATAAAAAARAAANPSELTSLIGLTRARLAQGQIDAPAGDSAVAYLTRARSLNAASPDVVALTDEVGAALIRNAETLLAAGNVEAAEGVLLRAQGLSVAGSAIAALELNLNVARETRTRAAQNALLASAAQRQAQGRLFTPAGASALDAVLEVRGLDPGHPRLPAAVDELETALTAAAEAAIAVEDWIDAEGAIDALTRLGAAEAVVAPLREAVEFSRTQAAYLAEVSPAAELEVLEYSAPVYPERALRRGTEGWVDLEFVVDREGRPRALTVLAAEPPEVFEAAALEAVGNYVFVPFERDGRVYARRVSLRLRFALE